MAVLPIGMSGEAGGYQIERSLRFNSADSTYLSRTPPSASNRKTWTWGGWVKRSELSTLQWLFTAGTTSTSRTYIGISASDNLFVGSESSTVILDIVTSQVFRDPSSWYHIVISIDTTQATAANRVRVYVNGTQVTSFSTASYPSQNTDLVGVNTTDGHYIGVRGPGGLNNYFGGYLTDINFIDGSALTPSSFGETDSDTGVWTPKAYTGSYGTNGFYLKFADNSGTTSTTLGKDSSPNGNNWTPNNFSVTAGAGNDSLVDTPTSYGTDTGAGGEVRGNYATLNPLDKGTYITTANGNLDVVASTQWQGVRATLGMSAGKWYCEYTPTSGTYHIVSISQPQAVMDGYIVNNSTAWGYGYDGSKYNGGSTTSYGATWGVGDTIGIAFDADAGTLVFYKNGTSQGTAYSSLTNGPYLVGIGVYPSATGTFNFGQRPFAYTAPSGFKALCTQNLPTPAIGATASTRADDYFNPVLYTGNGSAPRTITGVGFQPDFVWVKSRSNAYAHFLWDAVRGTNLNLFSNLTNAEANVATDSTDGGVSTSASDGFTLTAGTSSSNNVNNNGSTYVGWNWKANGSGSTNTAGTITSTVSANTTSGFSIVTYTGTGANATVGHGLGVAPSMVIVKPRSAVNNWSVYHRSLGASNVIFLDLTNASATSAASWNSTAPTSSAISVGTSLGINGSGTTFVAYCFAPVAGFSAFGSYTGNGSADGTFVYTNHRPALVLVKRTDSTGNWTVLDNKREGYNVDNDPLYPNLSDAEGTTDLVDMLSNGFKVRSTDASVNASGGTYIYMSVAENPFKYSLGR